MFSGFNRVHSHCHFNLMCFKRIKYCSIEYLASKIKCEILYLHNIKKLAC